MSRKSMAEPAMPQTDLLTRPVSRAACRGRMVSTFWAQLPERQRTEEARSKMEYLVGLFGKLEAVAGHDVLLAMAEARGWLRHVPAGATLLGTFTTRDAVVKVISATPAGLPRGTYLVEARR